MSRVLEAALEESAREVVIRIEGPFDAMAALDLERRLEEIPRGTRVVVDFSQVRDLGDLGVALLASGLRDSGRTDVVMRGLCHHHARMLQYLGLDREAMAGHGGSGQLH